MEGSTKSAVAIDYTYDIAISLLETDLSFAKAIKARLSDRFSVFLYSDAQKVLQFTDGLEKLSSVYKSEARGVLVLMRPQWGETRWTRVEREVIRSRQFEKTADFLLVVTMESMTVPDWIPAQYIYHDHAKWGIDTLIGSITAKIKQLGGEICVLTAAQIASKRAEDERWNTQRLSLIAQRGQGELKQRTAELLTVLEFKIKEIALHLQNRTILVKRGTRSAAVQLPPCSFYLVEREEDDRNSAPFNYRLEVDEFDGVVDGNYRQETRTPVRKRASHTFALDVDRQGNWFWFDMRKKVSVTQDELAESFLQRLLNRTNGIADGRLKLASAANDPSLRRQSSWVYGWQDDY